MRLLVCDDVDVEGVGCCITLVVEVESPPNFDKEDGDLGGVEDFPDDDDVGALNPDLGETERLGEGVDLWGDKFSSRFSPSDGWDRLRSGAGLDLEPGEADLDRPVEFLSLSLMASFLSIGGMIDLTELDAEGESLPMLLHVWARSARGLFLASSCKEEQESVSYFSLNIYMW